MGVFLKHSVTSVANVFFGFRLGWVRHGMARWTLPVALGLVLQACDEPQSPLKVQVGQTVPPLAVRDLQNNPTTLQPSPGKLLMINVWATWCGPCRHEMPSLQRLADKIGSERLDLVGLSVDEDEHVVREYLIEHHIAFPSLLDRDFAVANGVFGVRVFPSTFFLNPDGALVRVIEGWRDWDTPEMLAEIQDLLPVAERKSVQKPRPGQAGAKKSP